MDFTRIYLNRETCGDVLTQEKVMWKPKCFFQESHSEKEKVSLLIIRKIHDFLELQADHAAQGQREPHRQKAWMSHNSMPATAIAWAPVTRHVPGDSGIYSAQPSQFLKRQRGRLFARELARVAFPGLGWPPAGAAACKALAVL